METNQKNNRKQTAWKIVVVAGIILLAVLGYVWISGNQSDENTNTNTNTVMESSQVENSESSKVLEIEESSTESVIQEEEKTILPNLAKLYEENDDMAGWISIEDTVIDYPVMYTPEDEEKYMYADFEGDFDPNGLPFIDDACSLDPESDNLIIYAHNMMSGAMFASLMDYEKEEYWEEHPIISFSTLYEEREYEVIAVFYDRVYYKYEDCFKFYKFINAANEDEFEDAMRNYKEKALYDTGVTAEYGDNLITLVTCAYHIDNGRFVVVAREVQSTDTVVK